MADAYLDRMKQRKIDLEAKLKRLATIPDASEQSKKLTENGIAQLDAEIRRLTPPKP